VGDPRLKPVIREAAKGSTRELGYHEELHVVDNGVTWMAALVPGAGAGASALASAPTALTATLGFIAAAAAAIGKPFKAGARAEFHRQKYIDYEAVLRDARIDRASRRTLSQSEIESYRRRLADILQRSYAP
jgi:hypothetical protein